MNIRSRVYLSLALLYAISIFYLSSSPSAGSPAAIIHFLEPFLKSLESSGLGFLLYPFYIFAAYPDKAAHMVLYAGFGFLLYLALKNSPYQSLRNNAFIFAIIIGTAYGASDEFHQSFVPGRTASIWDLLADFTGVALAQAAVFIYGGLSDKKKASTLDLKLVLILMLLSILFILVPPFNQTYLRIILALPLLLFMPGYLFITVMFPRKGELSPIERFTLSIGMSIAITVFDGFALNYTPWGFRPHSIVMSLSLIMVLMLIAAYLQRRRRLGEQAYDFSIEHIKSFFRTLKSKETETCPEYDPALEKMLIKTMIIAILIVSVMLVYAKVTTEPEKFTALYILGEKGKAENYLTDVRIGETSTILTGVENYEHATVNYTLRVNLGGLTLREQEIILDHNSKWLNNVTFVPQLTSSLAFSGANRSKLEFQLLKDNMTYRSVHLLVNTSLDTVKFAALPNMTNSDMESDGGWLFSRNSMNITCRYSNSSGFSLSRAIEIDFISEKAGIYGTISQNLITPGAAIANLSFDVRDSDTANTSNYIFKQALIDGQVVWEGRAGGRNGSWDHIEAPVLLSGNNTLAFRVYSKYPVNYNATFWWDNVQLKPYGILPRTGDVNRKGDMDVKFSGFFSADNLSIIELSVENTGKNVKSFELKPAPVLIDDLGNKYDMIRIERGSQIAQTAIYPGVVRKGNIFFKQINSSADNISSIIYINGERYEFNFKNEPEIPEEIKEAAIGDTIDNSGFEVGLYGYQNTQNWNSNVIIAVKNMEYEEKQFKLSPAPVLIDDLGNQYDMIRVQRGSEIKQTTIYPGIIRRGSIYFEDIKPSARNLKLILYLNGEKYVFNFKAEPILLKEDDSFRNTSIKITASATIGETISQAGYNISLRGYQNTPDWASKIIIAVKNTDQEEKQFKLNPTPVLIDDLGNQYENVNIERGNQIKQTAVYPGVVRKGNIFFEPINPSAQHLWLIMYPDGERYIFSFKAEPEIIEDDGIPVDTARIPANATVGEALSRGGFEVRLKGFQNTPDWTSMVMISVRNIGNENKLLKINATTVLLDDLGNQYEMVTINRAGQIEQTTITPQAQKEGNIFFEPIKNEAKYVRLILRISSGKYEFGFEPRFNAT